MRCLCDLGMSARAIAGSGKDHPHDPADLLRCVDYCRQAGLDTADLRRRMAGKSVEWDRLLPEWDNLVALLEHEMATRTDGMASRTYHEMKRVLAAGTACAACDSTGAARPARNARAPGVDLVADVAPKTAGTGPISAPFAGVADT